MSRGPFKRYLPYSLYGRAALILLLPIVILQLVVSVVFIQRHFEGVTRQMTRNVVAEARYLIAQIEAAPDLPAARGVAAELGPALQLTAVLPAEAYTGDRRRFFDLSGRVFIATLRERIEGVIGVDLVSDNREVRVSLASAYGPLELRLPRSRVSASNPHQLLVLMISTGILMTLIAFIFLRNQLRPITRLASAADAFGKGRHIPYKPSGALEVRLAGQAFLDMRARIERHIEQRTMMLSGVSHDLRTPLTRLKLAVSLLEDPAEREDMLRDVRDMERLVQEFLSFARGDAQGDPEQVDAAGLARDAVAAAQRAGQAVSLHRCGETGAISMRPDAVTRALDNLISNAVRYGSRAWVSVAPQPDGVRFSIEDDGPGIAEELRPQALKAFARLDPSRNQNRRSGVGLGLAIAADIARRHGGALTLGHSAEFGGLRADLFLAR